MAKTKPKRNKAYNPNKLAQIKPIPSKGSVSIKETFNTLQRKANYIGSQHKLWGKTLRLKTEGFLNIYSYLIVATNTGIDASAILIENFPNYDQALVNYTWDLLTECSLLEMLGASYTREKGLDFAEDENAPVEHTILIRNAREFGALSYWTAKVKIGVLQLNENLPIDAISLIANSMEDATTYANKNDLEIGYEEIEISLPNKHPVWNMVEKDGVLMMQINKTDLPSGNGLPTYATTVIDEVASVVLDFLSESLDSYLIPIDLDIEFIIKEKRINA